VTDVRIDVLGPLRVTGTGITAPTRASQLRLLALFALEAGNRVGTERLIDMYWRGSPPTAAKAAIQTHVSALRRLLGPDLIKTEGYGYRLDPDVARLDSIEFDEAAGETHRAALNQDWETTLARASEALDSWRGPPYAELEDDDFARAEIARLHETHLELWEAWTESLLRLGRPGEALPVLERLVIEQPYRERLWEYLMTARYRLGRHADALAAYQELREHLAEIGVEPGPSVRHLEEKILLHDEELRAPPHNLPAEPTTFVGRHDELRDIAKLLGDHRLLTATGVGGSGKTRLAIQAAATLLDSFPDGCWFVSLADLAEAEMIPMEVLAALGIKPQDEDPMEALLGSIRHDEMLLVLDNCEHLKGVADVARGLIEAAGRVKILATSREPLHVPGELIYEVPPLDSPSIDVAAHEISNYDAVRLFVDRAALVDNRFSPDERSYSVVGSICRKLDGIPLAIELAAAKVRSFSLESIDRRLGERLLSLSENRTATIPRHQTLEAALAWSYDLLDEAERRVLARLAVFRGGFDLDMVEEVAGDPFVETLDILERLVEKSLVARERAKFDRYRLLEPVREFAGERLGESGVEPETLRRHLDWCVRFCSDLEENIYGATRHGLFGRLEVEIENLVGGLELAENQGDLHAISRIASAVAWHWLNVGIISQARASLVNALENVEDEVLREAEIRSRLARILWELGEAEPALAEALQADNLVRNREPSLQKVAVLRALSSLHSLLIDQDPRKAIAYAREAISVSEAVGDAVAIVQSRTSLGQAISWAGEVEGGLEVFRQALAESREVDDPVTAIAVYNQLFTGLYLHPVERRDKPRQLLEDLESRFPLDDWAHEIELSWVGYICIQTGEWDRANDVLQRFRERRLEGMERESYLMVSGTLSWMKGALDQASDAMKELAAGGINSRWYHDYYPLRTDIASDRGDIEHARSLADTYLEVTVDPSEEAKKLGALHPLVRAEVNAALGSAGAQRDDHHSRADAAVARMHAILEEFPPPTGGSQAMETPRTHLLFARAESSRVGEPRPDLWQQAAERADYIYFRLYARIRWAEALRQAGDETGATRLMEETRAELEHLGAEGLNGLLEAISDGA
jgi:predicted ATPase/DNA-binding winged helix-turn-helix (wHTH) protein